MFEPWKWFKCWWRLILKTVNMKTKCETRANSEPATHHLFYHFRSLNAIQLSSYSQKSLHLTKNILRFTVSQESWSVLSYECCHRAVLHQAALSFHLQHGECWLWRRSTNMQPASDWPGEMQSCSAEPRSHSSHFSLVALMWQFAGLPRSGMLAVTLVGCRRDVCHAAAVLSDTVKTRTTCSTCTATSLYRVSFSGPLHGPVAATNIRLYTADWAAAKAASKLATVPLWAHEFQRFPTILGHHCRNDYGSNWLG